MPVVVRHYDYLVLRILTLESFGYRLQVTGIHSCNNWNRSTTIDSWLKLALVDSSGGSIAFAEKDRQLRMHA